MPKTVPVLLDAAPPAGAPPAEAGPRSLGRLRGLDGLRGVAVLAVVIYHAGLGGLSGGFLGVEVFFVISGFLITALLLAEHRATGRIDLIGFWFRRGRRLLPALFFLLAAVLAFAIIVVPDEITRLRADAVAAIAYVTNWHLIAGDQSYFEAIGRPSLFRHLWSLAIEEQFYLIWPVALTLILLAGRRAALGLTLAGAAGSALWMALQFDPAVDPSRVYYGTDTRLTGLLLGAALAFVWVPAVASRPPRQSNRRTRRRARRAAAATLGHWGSDRIGRALNLVGLVSLASLGVFLATADAFEPYLYQGGLALVALLTVALIAAAVHPRAKVGGLLDRGPLRWVGTRSYSIYLWHWPIFALTRPGLDVPIEPLPAFVLRLGLTAALAETSYRFVETPARTGALGRTWAWLRSTEPVATPPSRRWPAPAAAGMLAAMLSVLLVSVAVATPPAPPEGMVTDSIDGLIVEPARPVVDRPAAPKTIAGPPTRSPVSPFPEVTGSSPPLPPSQPDPTLAPLPSPTPRQTVLAFGESVMIQGAKALAADLGPVRVDAAVGRQIGEGIEVLQRRAAKGKLAGIVVVQLGNNGPFLAGQFDAAMSTLKDVRLVVWVNVRVPRDWEAHNNRIVASGVARYPNARLVDWYGATTGRPELFWKDGYHPRPKGAELYADLIAAALR